MEREWKLQAQQRTKYKSYTLRVPSLKWALGQTPKNEPQSCVHLLMGQGLRTIIHRAVQSEGQRNPLLGNTPLSWPLTTARLYCPINSKYFPAGGHRGPTSGLQSPLYSLVHKSCSVHKHQVGHAYLLRYSIEQARRFKAPCPLALPCLCAYFGPRWGNVQTQDLESCSQPLADSTMLMMLIANTRPLPASPAGGHALQMSPSFHLPSFSFTVFPLSPFSHCLIFLQIIKHFLGFHPDLYSIWGIWFCWGFLDHPGITPKDESKTRGVF